MEGEGPIYGHPVEMNILMFSDNPLVADIVASEIMGFTSAEVKHLVLFNEQYVGLEQIQVEITGEKIENVKRNFKVAKGNWFVKLENELMRHPVMVKILFSDFFRKNITYYLNPLLSRLRGGSYSWYDK